MCAEANHGACLGSIGRSVEVYRLVQRAEHYFDTAIEDGQNLESMSTFHRDVYDRLKKYVNKSELEETQRHTRHRHRQDELHRHDVKNLRDGIPRDAEESVASSPRATAMGRTHENGKIRKTMRRRQKRS